MNRKVKFWILFLLGFFLLMPFAFLSLMASTSLYALLYAFAYLGAFLIYTQLLYRHVYKRLNPKYPLAPPEGHVDIYFPRTKIPRPVYEDVRRYPEFFHEKEKKHKTTRKVRKKS